MENYFIILAGGSGTRMGADLPKQFLRIGGKPILVRTVELFRSFDPDAVMIVVLPEDCKHLWKQCCIEENITFRHYMVSGGITRFHSVKSALEHVPAGARVFVHDGVRPFVPERMYRKMSEMLDSGVKAVVPALPLVDSIRETDGNGGSSAADRSRFVSVQTPQAFDSTILKKAYSQPYVPEFTDDASVVEKWGEKIALCEGFRYNIKITEPSDMPVAEYICNTFTLLSSGGRR